MKAAALLALLAALPARASDAVTPAQARANVVASFPQEIRDGVGNRDLRTYLQRLNPEQKQAALRSLTAKEGEFGDDPATLGVLGEAYAGLGNVKEAKKAAQAILRQNPDHPDAKRLMGWVVSQENLPERGSPGGAFANTAGPGGGGQSPAAARPTTSRLAGVEGNVQRVFRRGERSAEFRDVMEDARGFSVDELRAAGIQFREAKGDQRDAVLIERTSDGKVAISLRPDAFTSGGDAEARSAAHVANGVRQAQTYRDHNFAVAWALVKARGWISGARTHQQLAPDDIETSPQSAADRNLMMQRNLLAARAEERAPMPRQPESYGSEDDNKVMAAMSIMGKIRPSIEKLFEDFMRSTSRTDQN